MRVNSNESLEWLTHFNILLLKSRIFFLSKNASYFLLILFNEFSPSQGTTFITQCNPCALKAKNLYFTSGEQMVVPASFSDKRVIHDFDIKFLTEINFVSI